MKKYLHLLLTGGLLFLWSCLASQQVVTSAGGYYESGSVNFSYTIGEPVIKTLSSGEITLTQGFQQPFNFYVSQLIQVPAGWSGISSWVNPLNKGVTDIFEPFSEDFIILASMSQFYYPAGGVNTIGNWSTQTGYQIKALNPFEINLKGMKVADRTVLLNTGWNLIPVLNSCGAETALLFTDISGFVIIKEVAGVGLYWPQFGINTLENLAPGRAYWVAMNTSGSVVFPTCPKGKKAGLQSTTMVDHSPWDMPALTAASHVIAFPHSVLISAGIEPGDVIGGFTNEGRCAGVALVHENSPSLALQVFADDLTTPDKSGFGEGEQIYFRLFKAESGETVDLLAEFDPTMPQGGNFENHGLSAVKSILLNNQVVTSQELISATIFPNPSYGIFSLTMNHWPDKMNMKLLDTKGLLISNVEVGKQDVGESYTFNFSHLSHGIYFLHLTSKDGLSIIRKVVIQ